MRYRLGRLWRKARKRLVKILNDALPGRPNVDLEANVSFRAKIEGFAKNIRVERGARVREDAWLNCLDEGSFIEIGSSTLIMPYAKLVAADGGRIRIGRGCTIHSFNVLYGHAGGLVFGDNVRCATGGAFVSGNHSFDDVTKSPNDQGGTSLGITIGDNVWVGTGVIVLDGVTVGANTVLGAGSVVTKSVPENSVCVGVPAVVTRRRGEKPSQPL